MSELSTWVTVIASVISAFAAWRMWKVSTATLTLQQTIESEKIPLVHIWYNGTEELTPKILGGMTFINIGKESLPIRRMRILGNNKQPIEFKLLNPTQIKVKLYAADQPELLPKFSSETTDFILMPNEIFQASIRVDSNQLTLEVMYYDNSFEFIGIDTSNLGGKYILTGKGKKP